MSNTDFDYGDPSSNQPQVDGEKRCEKPSCVLSPNSRLPEEPKMIVDGCFDFWLSSAFASAGLNYEYCVNVLSKVSVGGCQEKCLFEKSNLGNCPGRARSQWIDSESKELEENLPEMGAEIRSGRSIVHSIIAMAGLPLANPSIANADVRYRWYRWWRFSLRLSPCGRSPSVDGIILIWSIQPPTDVVLLDMGSDSDMADFKRVRRTAICLIDNVILVPMMAAFVQPWTGTAICWRHH